MELPSLRRFLIRGIVIAGITVVLILGPVCKAHGNRIYSEKEVEEGKIQLIPHEGYIFIYPESVAESVKYEPDFSYENLKYTVQGWLEGYKGGGRTLPEIATTTLTSEQQDIVEGHPPNGDPPWFDSVSSSISAEEWINMSMEERENAKHAWIYRPYAQIEKMKNRINEYLRGTPLEGYGKFIVEVGIAYNCDPRLCVAVAEAESSCGANCFASHNAWGMLAYGGFSCWEDGITAFFDLLHKHWGPEYIDNSYQLSGYCVPDYPWMGNVDNVRRAI